MAAAEKEKNAVKNDLLRRFENFFIKMKKEKKWQFQIDKSLSVKVFG
jgi:hypothetical protein